MLTDIHLASKPVGLSINLSKTKIMLNENAITVAVDGNIIEKVDRYVYLGKTVTRVGDVLLEIKRRIDWDGQHSATWPIYHEEQEG